MTAAQAAAARVVRVFISSTFRDFGHERDLLVKRVFPELQRRARGRLVEVIGIDLRWGITEEESQQGETLPICLREIERSRPYFLCLLGERYGWTPQAGQYSEQLLAQQPWLREHAGGTSVTELEVLHGVLNAPEMAGRAFFYLRDPAWSQGRGPDFVSEGVEERAKLARLKQRVRASGLPVADYADPEAAAQRILEDLWRLIDAEFPEDEVPDAFERERRLHAVFAEEKRRNFVGREQELGRLLAFLAGQDGRAEAPGALFTIAGDSGKGKSALVAVALERHAEAHPHDIVFAHFATASPRSRTVGQLSADLQEFVGRRARAAGIALPPVDGGVGTERLLHDLLARGAEIARAGGGRFVFAVDGVDALDRPDADWLPAIRPAAVAVVLASSAYLSREARDGDSLILPELDPADVRLLVRRRIERSGRRLSEAQFARLDVPREPLHAVLLAAELGMVASHEELPAALDRLLVADDSDAMVCLALERLERDFGVEPVSRVTEALYLVPDGLSEGELMDYAGLAPVAWSALRLSMGDLLDDSDGRIVILAEDVLDAIAQRSFAGGLPDDVREILLRAHVEDAARLGKLPIACNGLEVRFSDEGLRDVFRTRSGQLRFREGSSLERCFATHGFRIYHVYEVVPGWLEFTLLGPPGQFIELFRALHGDRAIRDVRAVFHYRRQRGVASPIDTMAFGSVGAVERLDAWARRLGDRRRGYAIARQLPAASGADDRRASAAGMLALALAGPEPGDGRLIADLVEQEVLDGEGMWQHLGWILVPGRLRGMQLTSADRSELLAVAAGALRRTDRPTERRALRDVVRAEVEAAAGAHCVAEPLLELELQLLGECIGETEDTRQVAALQDRFADTCIELAAAIRARTIGHSAEALDRELNAFALRHLLSGGGDAELPSLLEGRLHAALEDASDLGFEQAVREQIHYADRIGGIKLPRAQLVGNLERLVELQRTDREGLSFHSFGDHLVALCGLLHELGSHQRVRVLLAEVELELRAADVDRLGYGCSSRSHVARLHGRYRAEASRLAGFLRLAMIHDRHGSPEHAARLALEALRGQQELRSHGDAGDGDRSTGDELERDDVILAEGIAARATHLAVPSPATAALLLRHSLSVGDNTVPWKLRTAELDRAIDALRETRHWKEAFEVERFRVELLRSHMPRSWELACAHWRLGERMHEWRWRKAMPHLVEAVECEIDGESDEMRGMRAEWCADIGHYRRRMLAARLRQATHGVVAVLVMLLASPGHGAAAAFVAALVALAAAELIRRWNGLAYLFYLSSMCIVAGVLAGWLTGVLAFAALIGSVVLVVRLTTRGIGRPYIPRRSA